MESVKQPQRAYVVESSIFDKKWLITDGAQILGYSGVADHAGDYTYDTREEAEHALMVFRLRGDVV